MEKAVTTLLPLCYFPNVDWYLAFLNSSEVLIESQENFVKQTYRNRCRILSANGPLDLVLPVKNKNNKAGITKMELNHNENWAWQHWHAIKSAYGKSAFFEFYEPYFESFFKSTQEKNLWEINLEAHKLICRHIKVDSTPVFTEEYQKDFTCGLDLRKAFKPSKTEQIFEQKPYIQVFADRFDFINNLSVLDLLFNLGPQSAQYLKTTYLNTLTIHG